MNGGEVVFHFKGNTDDVDKKTNKLADKVTSTLGTAGKAIGTAFLKGTAVATGALAGLITASVKSYADIEQSVGGIETLFGTGGLNVEEYAEKVGKSVDEIQEKWTNLDTAQADVLYNAQIAYKTAGISANEYMETVTSFSASLIASLGGDTLKASEYADRAIIDMSDNANKMGTAMESIQNAYQGFAKQNYTMLDNLKLGYGGTKEEMERLITDASKMTDIQNELNITVEDGNMSFGNIVNAISVMQKKLDITGTTAKEASETISGSINSAKAAFQNFLAGTGGVDEVVTTFTTAGTNIVNAINKMAPQILNGVIGIFQGLAPQIPQLVNSLLPGLITGATSLLNSLVQQAPTLINILLKMLPQLIQGVVQLIQGLLGALPQVMQMLVSALPSIINQLIVALVQLLPQLIVAVVGMIGSIAQALVEAIPILIASLPLIISSLITGLINAIPQLIMIGPQLLIGLITGIISAIPMLIQSAPVIIKQFIDAIISLVPNIIMTGLNLIQSLKDGILQAFQSMPQNIKNWIKEKLIQPLKDQGISGLKDAGKNLIEGLWNGIKNMGQWCINKIKGLGKSILKSVRDIFGIHSPSKEFAWIGKMNMEGLEEGMENMQPDLQKTINGMFDMSPSVYGSASNHFSPNVNVMVNNNIKQDPLGQMVNDIKTFSGGSKNDYNYVGA